MARRHHAPLILPEISHDACTSALRRELLKESPFFMELPDKEIDEVNRLFTDRGYGAGQTIVRMGEEASRLYIVALGVVKLYRFADSGETALVDILSSGDYFGSFVGYGPAHYEEEAAAASTVCALSIDTEEFRRIVAAHPAVALRAMEALSNRLRLAQEISSQLRGCGAQARIANVLLRLAEKLGYPWDGKTLIRSPLSREEIASMAATTTETCSRTLSSFKKEGLIDSGRGWVALADTERLYAAAREESA